MERAVRTEDESAGEPILARSVALAPDPAEQRGAFSEDAHGHVLDIRHEHAPGAIEFEPEDRAEEHLGPALVAADLQVAPRQDGVRFPGAATGIAHDHQPADFFDQAFPSTAGCVIVSGCGTGRGRAEREYGEPDGSPRAQYAERRFGPFHFPAMSKSTNTGR